MAEHQWCEIKERKANQRMAELEAQLASIKAEYDAMALANGGLQAENARLKAPVSEVEYAKWADTLRSHVCSCGKHALAFSITNATRMIAARAGKEQDNGNAA